MAATVSQLRAAPHARYAYLLAIEGVPYVFCTDQDVTQGWLSTYDSTRTMYYGLSVPDTLEFGIEGPLPVDGGAAFSILDHASGTITTFATHVFGDLADDIEIVYQAVPAGTTALTTLIGEGGGSVDPKGRWLGGERIGSSGERRQWQCIPFCSMPGQRHSSLDGDTSGSLAPVPVADHPPIYDGLRVALYQIVYDPQTLSWPQWDDQYERGALIWWGTLRTLAKVEGRTWTLKCDGPESWLRRTLSRNTWSEWVRARPRFMPRTVADYGYDGAETLVAAWLLKRNTDFTSHIFCASTMFELANELTTQNKSGIVGEIATILVALKTAGTTTFKNHAPFGDVKCIFEFIGVQIKESGSGYAGELHLVLHESVWHRLGYDPIYQNTPQGAEEGQYEAVFRPIVTSTIKPEISSEDPTPVPQPPTGRYYEGIFTTVKVGVKFGEGSAAENCNYELWRGYYPTLPEGYLSLKPGGGQELGLSLDPIYLESQLGRTDSGKWTVNGLATNSTRWLLIRAPYRENSKQEPRDLYQIAKVDWRDDGYGSPTPADNSWLTVVIDRWEDPRQWGINEKKLSRSWAVANSVEVLPLSALKYSPYEKYDYLHHVILRLLLSTGTATVAGDEYDAQLSLTPGDNHHPSATGQHKFATDAEIYDLGLSIPRDLINWTSFKNAADQLPGGWAGGLCRGVFSWSGLMQSQELLESLLGSRGLAIGLQGGKYTCYNLYAQIDADDAIAHIALSSLHGAPSDRPHYPDIELQTLQPVDMWDLQVGVHPAEDESTPKPIRARDVSAPWRQGRISKTIRAMGLVPASWFELGDTLAPPPWELLAYELFGDAASAWHGRPHHVVSLSVLRTVGQDIRPGDVVTITHPDLPTLTETQGGGYGLVYQPGRVVKTVLHLDSGHVDLQVRLEGNPGVDRRWAPVARLVEGNTDTTDRYDPVTYTWYCYGDGFGHGYSVSDVSWFAEPAWSDLGGGMLVQGYQYDGITWRARFTFTVASVDTVNHTITATGAYSGTYMEREYTLLVPAAYDVQTSAWAKALLQWITDTFGGFAPYQIFGWKLI